MKTLTIYEVKRRAINAGDLFDYYYMKYCRLTLKDFRIEQIKDNLYKIIGTAYTIDHKQIIRYFNSTSNRFVKYTA